ncbi:MAG: hypothetical protein M1836_002276 [Candelina mexicana]|nr:MAG: hypothetical protein M1836_002276 [Candelina mexicana]
MPQGKPGGTGRGEWDDKTRALVLEMREKRVSGRDIEVKLGVPKRTQYNMLKRGLIKRKRTGRPPKPDCDLKYKRRRKSDLRWGEPQKPVKPMNQRRYKTITKAVKDSRARMEQLNNTFYAPKVPSRHFHSYASLDIFHELCSQTTSPETYPLSDTITSNIPIYDAQALYSANNRIISLMQDEWHHTLLDGPGIFVVRGLYRTAILDTTNTVLDSIIHAERSTDSQKGDHFSANNANHRVWNSFGKHGSSNPQSFLDYYSNQILAMVCEAWLGPGYRINAQVNIINPGGAPEVCHRDYHLGFQNAEACERFPAQTQMASQFLTLQGAVAHTDMPIESGPTRFLPFSQQFAQGYMAYRRSEFQDYFDRNFVAIPLEKGDAIFFNPALFHAAGEDTLQGFERKANLLQVSSAFGKPMEAVDSLGLIVGCWPFLYNKYEKEGRSKEVEAFVRAVAEGYPFPTNLDRRPPGPERPAPESEQELVFKALKNQWSREMAESALLRMRQESSA